MYTVKFLDSESFDNLPYNKVGTSLGVADRNSGIAYVRDTGEPMDVFTAYHELEHLKGDDLDEYESPGEDGVYYKSTGSWMQTAAPFASFIPGIGPLISGGLGIAGGAMDAKQQAKAQQSQMQQQGTMNQFNPTALAPIPQSQPAVSSVGGGSSGGGEMATTGSLSSGIMDRLREIMKQRQSGFYAGRDAGGAQ